MDETLISKYIIKEILMGWNVYCVPPFLLALMENKRHITYTLVYSKVMDCSCVSGKKSNVGMKIRQDDNIKQLGKRRSGEYLYVSFFFS